MSTKKLALIYGGDSSEAEVSVKSGKHIASHIDRTTYSVYEILITGRNWRVVEGADREYDIDKSDFSFTDSLGNKVVFDSALIMIHGTPGENGLLQAYFEMVGVKYASCSSIVSAITFDKYACKCVLRDTGVKMAKEVFLRKGDLFSVEEVVAKVGLPVFVKPNDGGSSFGVTKVKKVEDLVAAVESAFKEGESVLIEEFIPGREMTNGVYLKDGVITALPVTEIIPDNEFFDYEAKYLGASKEICPAHIPDSLRDEIQKFSVKIYHHLGCRGIVRVDYIVNDSGIYFLEINTIPGMTQMSLVPQQVRAAGMTIGEFISQVLV